MDKILFVPFQLPMATLPVWLTILHIEVSIQISGMVFASWLYYVWYGGH